MIPPKLLLSSIINSTTLGYFNDSSTFDPTDPSFIIETFSNHTSMDPKIEVSLYQRNFYSKCSNYRFPSLPSTPPHASQCGLVNLLPPSERCDFINRTKDCDVDSFIDYVSFMYCAFEPVDQPIAITISVSVSIWQLGLWFLFLSWQQIIWMLVLFIALGVAATDLWVVHSVSHVSHSMHN